VKEAYPVVITKENDGYFASIPDFNIDTQGTSVVNAIAMARDAIGLMGIDLEDDGKEIPKPNSVKVQVGENYTVTLVDVDFTQYYRKVDNRAVKKNCTISYWLNVEAEKSGINFSKVLQEALMQ
jgi:predicted RNase H-like HicB family nuclease